MSSIESIIDRQIRRWELERQIQGEQREKVAHPREFRPVITVSRQRGSRGSYIAERLAERFGYELLHRDLIDRICKSSGYKKRLVASMDEKSQSDFESWLVGVLSGPYVDQSDYTRHLLEVIYPISSLGGVVVVGRGANFIIGMDRGFHVRVVAPADDRVRNLMTHQKFDSEQAAREVESKDEERSDFIKKYFGKSIDDPLHYDLIINSATVSVDTAIHLIATAGMEKLAQIRAAS
jgi:cytidylate kinase